MAFELSEQMEQHGFTPKGLPNYKSAKEDFDYKVIENKVVSNYTEQREAVASEKRTTDAFDELSKKYDKQREAQKDSDQAMRFNKGKSQLSYMLDADVAMKGMCNVFEFGAKKYDRGNWKKGLDEKEIMDSMLRHLTAYNNGEVLDPESGLPHVDHITCNAVFLATFGKRV